MAIKTNTREVASLWENIKNISGIGWIVPDTLLWLAETLENRIVIDATTVQFFDNIAKWLDIAQQVNSLKDKITDDAKKIKRPNVLPRPNDMWGRAFDIWVWDVNDLASTITSLERAQQEKVALNNSILDNSATIQNNKGNGAVQAEARTKASNNKQIINYDLREANRIEPLLSELKTLQTFQNNYGAILTNRKQEFNDMHILSQKFDVAGNIQTMNNTLNHPKNLSDFTYKDTLWTPVPLQTVFFGANNPENPSYAVCDINTGKKLDFDNGYSLNISGKDVKIKWLTIGGTDNNELNIDNLEIDPIQDLKFPITIKFGVRWSQSKNGVNLDTFKPLTINLQAPKMSQTERQANYNRYNGTNTIDDRIISEYNNKRVSREDEVIRDLLRANWNEAEVNKIYENETLRNEFIKQVRNNTGIPLPMLDIWLLQTEFKNKITDAGPSSKVPLQYLISDNAFTDYLRQNIAKNVENFLKKKVKKNIDWDIDLRNNILTTFTKFDTNLSKTLWDDPSVRTDTERTLNIARSNKRKRRDNYMRFLIWRSESLKDQSLELADKKHSYSIDLSCETMNKVVANIEVDGQKIALAGRNLNELLKSIVNSGGISSNKLAVHVAFGAVKTMIKMMKSNNMDIDIRNGHGNIVETRINDDKLIINEIDSTWRTVSKIFDEDHFKNLKDFNTLDIALGQLTKDFHQTMHYYNQDYKKATQYTRVNRIMKYDPRWTRGLRRIRKTWNWRKRNTLDFEFPPTAVTVWDRTANISFEKWKFTLSMWDKEYTSRNIGRLLKKNKEFDGMQMDIMAAINSKYVDMLRVNPRIAKTNFGVYNRKLRRLYVLDSSGKLNYIDGPTRNPISGRTKWQWYWKIMEKNMPNSMIPVTDDSEIAQFWQNPLLGGRMVKSMQRRLWGI